MTIKDISIRENIPLSFLSIFLFVDALIFCLEGYGWEGGQLHLLVVSEVNIGYLEKFEVDGLEIG